MTYSCLFTRSDTEGRSADASGSEESDSSDELDEKYFTCGTSTTPTGITGSTITLKKDEKYYTWESKKWTSAVKYIDIKVYENPKTLRNTSAMDLWRHASFRAKVLIGNPLKPHRDQPLLKLVNQLQKGLVENFVDNHPTTVPRISDGKRK